ncbi:glycosyltransferase [Prochlorococcus sp. AH-716-D22]|nr:glycosyltransferase [Prochlorococcus sp. AH-716-D22]
MIPEKNNILILTQGNQRSIYLESLAIGLKSNGYNISFGIIGEYGPLQNSLSKEGIKCYCFKVNKKPLIKSYFSNFKYWSKVIKKDNIGIILSHLQWANLIALILEKFFFRRIKVITTRHHVDASFLTKKNNAKLEDFIINFLSKKQVVVSKRAKSFMLKKELFASSKKIFYIPLGYDFAKYLELKKANDLQIRKENNCKFLIITISRIKKTKKHMLVLEAFNILINRGLDIKWIILDQGPLQNIIEEKIKKLQLEDKIKMYGNQENIIDYLEAADLLVQPSIEESSNQTIKEAAILGMTAIITKNIGDYDDYVEDKKNAFFISKNISSGDLANLIQQIYNEKYNLQKMGASLNETIKKRFSIENTVKKYIELIKN